MMRARILQAWGLAAGLTMVLASAVIAQDPCCRSARWEIAERYRIEGLDERRFTHDQYWGALASALESDRVRVARLGESLEGRPIRAITLGRGPTSVLLWSQMHGDESTASMSLADLVNWFALSPDSDALRRTLADRLTITMIPMLNPDGAERFVRVNLAGVDINRDARRAATPEGRILRAIRDSLEADFGFNLHDQGTRTAGEDGPVVAIALLAPAADPERSWGPVRQSARQVAAVIATTLEPDLGSRMARYDDEFTPRAFGDNMQLWGTSTVLIESGMLGNDPQKQELRKLNVVGLLGALHAIATGDYDSFPTDAYDDLPMNLSLPNDVLLLGGNLIAGIHEPILADVAIRFDDAVAGTGPRYGEIGDLFDVAAVDTIDVTGLFIHATPGDDGMIRPGDPAEFTVRDGRKPASKEILRIGPEE